jgi:hypothetical protein
VELSEETSKIRAEIRARQAEDGRKAMAEYHANAAALRARTDKLKALRLAREAREAAEARAKPASVAKARSGAKVSAPKVSASSASAAKVDTLSTPAGARRRPAARKSKASTKSAVENL